MRVDNFLVTFEEKKVIFSADFVFTRPPGTRKERFLFYFYQLRANWRSPAALWKNGVRWKERIWFSLPQTAAQSAQYEDAFFLLALGMCLHSGEDLYFAHTVSPDILAKLPAFKQYFDYGRDREIQIRYHLGKRESSPKKGTAQFFTLGVDSFFVLLCHAPKSASQRPLVYVEGFDVPLQQKIFLQNLRSRFQKVARKIDTSSVFLQTNLREVSDKKIGWGVFHVTALAAVGLLLPYKHMLLGGESFNWPDWGLRSGVDQLFSTDSFTLQVINHNVPRRKTIQKLLASKHSSLFLENVRVCWQNVTFSDISYNCSRCQKCLRTKLTLQLLGVDDTPTLAPITSAAVDEVFLSPHVQEEWDWIIDQAKKSTRIDLSVRRSLQKLRKRPLIQLPPSIKTLRL